MSEAEDNLRLAEERVRATLEFGESFYLSDVREVVEELDRVRARLAAMTNPGEQGRAVWT